MNDSSKRKFQILIGLGVLSVAVIISYFSVSEIDPQSQPHYDIYLVTDVSGSMGTCLREDMFGSCIEIGITDESPIVFAKKAAVEFKNKLKYGFEGTLIGGGFPLGAVLMNKKVASTLTAGSHGSTFGGNPLAMSVGNAVMDLIFKKGFLKNVQKISKYFMDELKKIKEDYPEIIKEVRGIGLLLGLQLHGDQTKFIKELEKNKLLTIKAGENVIRILPPLNVRKQEIDLAIKIIRNTCNQESNL